MTPEIDYMGMTAELISFSNEVESVVVGYNPDELSIDHRATQTDLITDLRMSGLNYPHHIHRDTNKKRVLGVVRGVGFEMQEKGQRTDLQVRPPRESPLGALDLQYSHHEYCSGAILRIKGVPDVFIGIEASRYILKHKDTIESMPRTDRENDLHQFKVDYDFILDFGVVENSLHFVVTTPLSDARVDPDFDHVSAHYISHIVVPEKIASSTHEALINPQSEWITCPEWQRIIYRSTFKK